MSTEHNPPTGADVLIPVTTIIALSFVAIAVPLQFSREWVELGWIAVASLLWFFSCRIGEKTFTIMSAVFFLLGGAQFLVVDFIPTIQYQNVAVESFTPVWSEINWVGFAFAAILMSAGIATILQIRHKEKTLGIPFSSDCIGITHVIGLLGLWLFWFLSTMEVFHYFGNRSWIHHVPLISAVGLSLYWVFFARTVQVLGFAIRSERYCQEGALVRLSSAAMFFLTIGKIALIDIWRKPLEAIAAPVAEIAAEIAAEIVVENGEQTATWFDWLRPDYAIPVWNFYAIPILAVAGVLIAASIHAHRGSVLKTVAEKIPYSIIGLAGLAYVWLILSIECYYFFDLRDSWIPEGDFLAVCSLTYLWTLFGAIVFGLGVWKNAYVLRIVGQLIFLITALKSLILDLPQRPDSYEIPFVNPYAISVLLLVGVIFAVGIWTCRGRSLRIVRSQEERSAATALGVFALAILWLLVSWETYLYFNRNSSDLFIATPIYGPYAVLSVIWSMFGLILFFLGMKTKSIVLRYFGCCVFLATAIKSVLYDLVQRPEVLPTPLWNPFGLPMLCVVITFLLVGVWSAKIEPPLSKEERTGTTIIGVLGILILWLGLSSECLAYFQYRAKIYPEAMFLASSSMSVVWTILGTALVVIGIREKSVLLRTTGLFVFLCAAGKTVLFDWTRRPESYLTPFWNPFAVPALVIVVALIALAVWSTRIRPAESKEERNILAGIGILGLLMLWGLMSTETSSYFLLRETLDTTVRQHLSNVSVSTVWLLLAVLVFAVAIPSRSDLLRYTAIGLTVCVIFRAAIVNLLFRPDYLDPFWVPIYIPIFNTYMLPLLLLSSYLMIVGIVGYHRMSAVLFEVSSLEKWAKDKYAAERDIYKTFAFCGVAILLVSSSIECFRAFNSDKVPENVQAAQMSLSILWSIFAGILMFIGFRWRSSILRWCSIVLLTVTTGKVFLIDLASIHEVYRIGAFFTLAVVLWLAARAYQRFRPDEHR